MAKQHKAREDQENLPGTDEKNPRVHTAAKQYAKRHDERMAATQTETDAHDKLMEIMEEEGLDVYSYGDVDVSINSSKKCKVHIGPRKDKRGDAEEADESAK